MINIIPQLMEAGVDAFKIEGRMKSPYYVAAVVKVYRGPSIEYCQEVSGYEAVDR